MKNIILYVVFAFVTLKGHAQVEAVQQTVTQVFSALADRNTEEMKNHLTSDCIVLEHGAIWNTDTLVSKVNQKKNVADFKRVNTLEFLDTKITGNIAWTYYYNNATLTSNGKTINVKWLESAVLVQENSTWKIKLLHSTVLKRN